MSAKPEPARRSSCPINAFVEVFGDRWSLLIVRDLMLRGYRTYKQLQSSEEGIATNILAERLDRLLAGGIIERDRDPADGRKLIYRLTAKGIDLAPAIVTIARWSLRHEPTRASRTVVDRIKASPEGFVAEVRRRWVERATDSLLPTPGAPSPGRATTTTSPLGARATRRPGRAG
jgi:DNA-binding HxlR family transcriptional regulator